MSIRGVSTFKEYFGTVKGVNEQLKHSKNVDFQIGKLGNVTVKFKVDRPGGSPLEMNLTRNELAKYVTSLAMKMEDPAKAKKLLETFKGRMERLETRVESGLSFKESKRVKAGRKLASFSKHFFGRDKDIEKALERLDKKIST